MTLTRRALLRGGALLPWWLALAACGDEAAFGFGSTKAPAAGGEDLPPPDPLLHLMKRTRFGISPADYERAQSIGMGAYLEEQLAPETLPNDVELEATQ